MPSTWKNFWVRPWHEAFSKGLFAFPGLNLLTSSYLVNIQPNSKLHPLHQNFLDPPLGDTVSDLTGQGIELEVFRTDSKDIFPTMLTDRHA